MLRQPARQSGDRDFVHLLNEVFSLASELHPTW